ncbi:MAG: glycoside hydrolase family 26 protein [Bifidobacteriaceae bacterium]|jgi:mannan endo-1,4-beta-mannosidase|nr:glycoside hydrolase family 26 protein [Bifidobacteriaceae bacterium]
MSAFAIASRRCGAAVLTAALVAAAGLGTGAAQASARATIAVQAPPSSLPLCEDLSTPSDPSSTPETTALWRQLLYGAAGTTLYGQEDDLALNSVNTDAQVRAGAASHNGDSAVKEATGLYPAVFGWDIGQLELKRDNAVFGSAAAEGRPSALPAGNAKFDYDGLTSDGIPWNDLVRWIREAHEIGGLNTLSWSAVNPVTYQPGQPNVYPQSIASVLPGGAHHARFAAWLDTIVEFNQELVDDDGNPIPIVFRPYHEHSGSWYWWNIDDSTTGLAPNTAEQFAELWRFTVDYLRAAGVHNFLYAYSPDRSTLGDPTVLDGEGNAVPGPDGSFQKLDDSAFDEFMSTRWEQAFWSRWSKGFPGVDYVDVYGLDNYWDTGQGHLLHPYRGDEAKLRQLLVSTLAIVAEHATEDGKLAALTQSDLSPAQMIADVAGAGADAFGQEYAAAGSAAYVLRWRGQTEGLATLRDDGAEWFALPGGPGRWSGPVPCSTGGLMLEFDARAVTLGTPSLSTDKAWLTGSAPLPTIRVTDTRAGSPGWDTTIASGQYLVGPDQVDAKALGLSPKVTETTAGLTVVPGSAVAAGSGFVGGMPLASSPPGSSRGQAAIGGVLSYKISATVSPGSYQAVLSVTVL